MNIDPDSLQYDRSKELNKQKDITALLYRFRSLIQSEYSLLRPMKIGENIRLLRELRGWSQQGLADVIGISQKQVSRIEADEVSPRLSLLTEICEIWNISIVHLLHINKKQLLQELRMGKLTNQAYRESTDISALVNLLEDREQYIRRLKKKLKTKKK